MTSAELTYQVRNAQLEGREVSTPVARTIAGYWHGGQGSAFYSFSSSGHYDRAALLSELSSVIGTSYSTADADDRLQLDMLGTYLLNRDTFGVVTINAESVAIEADSDDFDRWAHRPGSAWPCSTLVDIDALSCGFDTNGLVELEGDGESLDSHEFNAWAADALEAAGLSPDHPCHFVTVGQFR